MLLYILNYFSKKPSSDSGNNNIVKSHTDTNQKETVQLSIFYRLYNNTKNYFYKPPVEENNDNTNITNTSLEKNNICDILVPEQKGKLAIIKEKIYDISYYIVIYIKHFYLFLIEKKEKEEQETVETIVHESSINQTITSQFLDYIGLLDSKDWSTLFNNSWYGTANIKWFMIKTRSICFNTNYYQNEYTFEQSLRKYKNIILLFKNDCSIWENIEDKQKVLQIAAKIIDSCLKGWIKYIIGSINHEKFIIAVINYMSNKINDLDTVVNTSDISNNIESISLYCDISFFKKNINNLLYIILYLYNQKIINSIMVSDILFEQSSNKNFQNKVQQILEDIQKVYSIENDKNIINYIYPLMQKKFPALQYEDTILGLNIYQSLDKKSQEIILELIKEQFDIDNKYLPIINDLLNNIPKENKDIFESIAKLIEKFGLNLSKEDIILGLNIYQSLDKNSQEIILGLIKEQFNIDNKYLPIINDLLNNIPKENKDIFESIAKLIEKFGLNLSKEDIILGLNIYQSLDKNSQEIILGLIKEQFNIDNKYLPIINDLLNNIPNQEIDDINKHNNIYSYIMKGINIFHHYNISTLDDVSEYDLLVFKYFLHNQTDILKLLNISIDPKFLTKVYQLNNNDKIFLNKIYFLNKILITNENKNIIENFMGDLNISILKTYLYKFINHDNDIITNYCNETNAKEINQILTHDITNLNIESNDEIFYIMQFLEIILPNFIFKFLFLGLKSFIVYDYINKGFNEYINNNTTIKSINKLSSDIKNNNTTTIKSIKLLSDTQYHNITNTYEYSKTKESTNDNSFYADNTDEKDSISTKVSTNYNSSNSDNTYEEDSIITEVGTGYNSSNSDNTYEEDSISTEVSTGYKSFNSANTDTEYTDDHISEYSDKEVGIVENKALQALQALNEVEIRYIIIKEIVWIIILSYMLYRGIVSNKNNIDDNILKHDDKFDNIEKYDKDVFETIDT